MQFCCAWTPLLPTLTILPFTHIAYAYHVPRISDFWCRKSGGVTNPPEASRCSFTKSSRGSKGFWWWWVTWVLSGSKNLHCLLTLSKENHLITLLYTNNKKWARGWKIKWGNSRLLYNTNIMCNPVIHACITIGVSTWSFSQGSGTAGKGVRIP